ncbi:MAG: hypothetical protein H6707_00435 [Deltaproteobacteria bacterium]|nr:hypothetical protein [Deltaproteobacteria bacterium]
MANLLDMVLPGSAGERRRALVAALLAFCLMFSYYIFKPVRGSLFVHYLGAENLPYAYAASAILALLAMFAYNRVLIRFSSDVALRAVVYALVVCAIIFWLILSFRLAAPGPVSVALMLWVSIYGVLVSTLFWSLAADSFDTAGGRRVFHFLGSGLIGGALFGSITTDLLIRFHLVTTENLLVVGSVVLGATLPLIGVLSRGEKVAERVRNPGPKLDGWRLIARDRYLIWIATLVFVMTYVGTFLDLQYNRVVGAALRDKELMTAYFGRLFLMVNGAGLLLQFFVTNPLSRRYGPLPGLFVLPLLGSAGPTVLLLEPTLTWVTLAWAGGLALLYSLNQACKEQLYIPLSHQVKYGAKGYIDVFVYRFGDASASLTVIVLRLLFQHSLERLLPQLCFVGLVFWLFALSRVARGYRKYTDLAGDDNAPA